MRNLPQVQTMHRPVARLASAEVKGKEAMRHAMNVEIDYLIDTCEKQLKALEGSGKVDLGIVLMCALKLFKREKENEEGGAK
jgi:hypothetical protein